MSAESKIPAVITAVLGLLLIAHACDASANPIELSEVTLGYKQLMPGASDPLISQNGLTDRESAQEIELHLNTVVGRYGYFNNRIHTTTDRDSITGERGQFRSVGWQLWLGLRLTQTIAIEYEHHSAHVLDHARPEHFPTQDSLGVKIFLFRSSLQPASLF